MLRLPFLSGSLSWTQILGEREPAQAHGGRREIPAGEPGHADRVVIGILMTGRAAEAGRAEAVGAAPHRRLMGYSLIALPSAIVSGVAIPTSRMLEDLAGLDEEGNRALGPVDDGGEGLGPAQRGGVLSAGCARGAAAGERGDGDGGGHDGRVPSPGARGHDGLAPPPASRENGRRWTGRPLSASQALATAGAMGGTPGSPTPVGGAAEGTMCTSTRGISSMRRIRKSWKLDCCTRPSTTVISLQSAEPRPKPMLPSICARTTSGFTAMPQSTAQTTRSTLGRPSPSRDTSATWATTLLNDSCRATPRARPGGSGWPHPAWRAARSSTPR